MRRFGLEWIKKIHKAILFWNKNGFVTVGENQYIIMERIIR